MENIEYYSGLTPFSKHWVTITVAPESICTKKISENIFIHSVVNPKQKNQTFVLEDIKLSKYCVTETLSKTLPEPIGDMGKIVEILVHKLNRPYNE